MTNRLGGTIRACVFDAYGTLFDVHSAVSRLRDRIGPAADLVSETWRQKQLQYSWLRSLMGRHADFWTVTDDALGFALENAGIEDAALHADLMALYRRLAPYPEAGGVLGRLKAAGLSTAILSNGSPAMLEAAAMAAGLTNQLDHILSVEAVGVYKPDPRVYRLATERLGLTAPEIAFMSSNGWDAAGAAAFGFRVVWVNRPGAPWERLGVEPVAVLPSLQGLPDLVGVR
jgi:2-haloacid dehalogenase